MTYSIDIINQFIEYASKNNNLSLYSSTSNISKKTLTAWYNIYNDNIINKTPITHRYNSNKIHGLSKKHLYSENIIKYVNTNEGCSLKEISNDINNKLSLSTICILLKKNGITHKKFKTHITPKTLEQIYNMRKNYSTTINKNEFLKDIVSIDETSININDLRRYGYIKKGKELQKHFQHKHTKERVSCLSAISTDGFIIYKLFKGTVNSENYLSFIKDNVEYFKTKILLQDNARIHHAKIVSEFAKENNIKLKFNPPYSPEFNPVEELFRKIKILLRNKHEHSNLENDIKYVYNNVSLNDIKSYFL